MNVLLPKNNKIDKTRILGQVLDSSFQFENGLQSNSPWKTSKKERRATVCPEVQKSPKLGKGSKGSKKPDRKSLPVGPKIKLDGPLKRRKKSAKQIEKAEQEYAFFDSSQDEAEVDEFGDDEGKKIKTTSKVKTPAKVKSATKSNITAKNKPAKVDSPTVKGKARSKLNKAKTTPKKSKATQPTSSSKKVKATVKKASNKNSASPERKKTPVKKAPQAKKTPTKKKTPAATKKPTKPAAVGTRRSTRNIELSK